MVTVYSTEWCPDCRRTERILLEQNIPFSKVDIEQHPEAAQIVMAITGGKRSVPTLVFERNGETHRLVNPSPMTLAKTFDFSL